MAKPINPIQREKNSPGPGLADIVPAPDPVVVTVNNAVFPVIMELGLIEHSGAVVSIGCTEHARAMEPLNPPVAVSFTVELDEAPGFIVPGVSAEAESKKPSGVTLNAVPKRPVPPLTPYSVVP